MENRSTYKNNIYINGIYIEMRHKKKGIYLIKKHK